MAAGGNTERDSNGFTEGKGWNKIAKFYCSNSPPLFSSSFLAFVALLYVAELSVDDVQSVTRKKRENEGVRYERIAGQHCGCRVLKPFRELHGRFLSLEKAARHTIHRVGKSNKRSIKACTFSPAPLCACGCAK